MTQGNYGKLQSTKSLAYLYDGIYMSNTSSNGTGTSGQDQNKPAQNNPMGPILLGLMMVVIGTIISISQFFSVHNDQSLIRNGESVQGTITEIDKRSSGKKLREYVTVEYKASDGTTHSVTESQRVSSIDYKKTDPDMIPTVYYDVDNPDKAVVKGWEMKYVDILVGGLILGFGAILMLVYGIKLKNMPPMPMKGASPQT